jgi:REP element-mobilizing transposase RayT
MVPYHEPGRRSEAIFSGKEDFQIFIALLEETAEMWNIRISAYCLMPKHYHLLLQTPDENISRGMRHINGIYTQRSTGSTMLTVPFLDGGTSQF